MKKEERHQIKRDDLATALERASDFAGEHVRGVVVWAVVAVVVVLAVTGGRAWWNARQATQARQLGEMIETYNAPITASLEDLQTARPGVPSFTSVEERDRKVLELADSILGGGGSGSAAAGARLYRGIALAETGKIDEAIGAFEEVIARHPEAMFAPVARLRLARLRENSGQHAEAAALYRAIADDTSGILPQEEGILGLARCQEALGKSDDAERLYQRILDEFPESEYVVEARTHLSDAA
jgi:tetratricopeptide (TPR) repeat protein